MILGLVVTLLYCTIKKFTVRVCVTFQCWQLTGWWQRRVRSTSPHSSSSYRYQHSWHSCPPGYRYHRSKFIILQVPEIMALMSTWTQASQVKGLTRQVSWVRISRMTCLRVRTKKAGPMRWELIWMNSWIELSWQVVWGENLHDRS